MPISEHRVKIEKGTVLSIAIGLIVGGCQLTAQGTYGGGIAMIVCGFALLYWREHLKFRRWGHVETFWRGKSSKEEM